MRNEWGESWREGLSNVPPLPGPLLRLRSEERVAVAPFQGQLAVEAYSGNCQTLLLNQRKAGWNFWLPTGMIFQPRFYGFAGSGAGICINRPGLLAPVPMK
jgi:hypothetical protein